MPSRIVVVLDDFALARATAVSLNSIGFESIALRNSMAALDALEGAERIELLVTSTDFPEGQPNGLALARMTKLRRPDFKAIFIGSADLARLVDDLGTLMTGPVGVGEIVEAVRDVMAAKGRERTT